MAITVSKRRADEAATLERDRPGGTRPPGRALHPLVCMKGQGVGQDAITLLLAGDVMTGRGIDQVMPAPLPPVLYEGWVRDARDYVRLAEEVNGAIAWVFESPRLDWICDFLQGFIMKSSLANTAFRRTVLGIAIAAGAAGAQAITVEGNTGMLASPDSFSLVVDSAGGADILSFTLRGYGSLDGDNFWIDIFHLSLNGVEIFAGTFDMGGSFDGTNRILFNPNGGTASPTSFGWFAGGKTEISIPIVLLAGSNTLLFSYESPLFFEGLPREGPQGLGDEGWGLSAIPEPHSYVLMLAGLAVVGTLARRRGADAG